MTMAQPHIIGRIVLKVSQAELGSPQSTPSWAIQEQFSQLLHQKAMPEIEALFDRIISADAVVRLGSLTIEIPPVAQHRLTDDFVPQLIAALDSALSDALRDSPTERTGDRISNTLLSTTSAQAAQSATSNSGVSDPSPTETAQRSPLNARQSSTAHDWQAFLHFLAQGRFPWNHSSTALSTWIARWKTALQQDTTWRTDFQQLIATHSRAKQRLISQLPAPFLHQLILRLQPTWTRWPTLLKEVQSMVAQLSTVQPATHESPLNLPLSNRAVQSLIQQAWQDLFSQSQPNTSLSAPFPTRQWIHSWLPRLTAVISTQSMPSTSAQPIADEAIRDYLHTLVTSNRVSEQTVWSQEIDRVTRSSSDNNSANFAQEIDSVARSNSGDSPVDSERSIPSPSMPLETAERSENPDLTLDERTHGIYLNNAGLVLLHPFLKVYFEAVGLLTDNRFRDDDAQQEAITLLHYLATGQTTAPEYDLILPKLLCGWPLEAPLTATIAPTATAYTEAETLLQTAINYWNALKGTSPDGLREGFLQRQGKLTFADNWTLRVEQQSIDILLSRLPWGISMVKLPWMPELLVVNWT